MMAQELETSMKSPGFAPVRSILLNTSEADPQLVMVTLWIEPVVPTPTLPKLIELLEKQIEGASATPTPVRDTIVGLPTASSAITRVATRVPTTWGVNVTLSVQKLPGAIGAPVQAGDCENAKSFDPAPVMDTLEMFKAAEPQLVIVMLCPALVVVSNWLPKLSVLLLELRQSSGAAGVAVPLSGTVRGLPVASSVKTRFA
jgi:hypothetical protein